MLMGVGVGVHADLKIDRRCLFVVLESRGPAVMGFRYSY